MTERLSVTLATIARFHMFELAAQLDRRGALAAVYTGLARRFVGPVAVPPGRLRCFPWIQTPLEALQRLGLMPGAAARALAWRSVEALDAHIARTLPDCHILGALSGTGLRAGRLLQARGGAWVCDRASSHIVWQDRILRAEYEGLGLSFPGVERRILEKEQAEYEAADAILAPSNFVRRSFIEMGVAANKIHVVPFGVNLGAYQPSEARDEKFRILFVGQLSVRKGLHYLLQAVRRAALSDAKLVLVGAAQPETEALLARFPVARLERTGPLPRARVAAEMSRAAVLMLPSIEEGLAYVQAEAMACACPVIASANTGADDLFTDGVEGFILPVGDVDGMADRLTRLHGDRALQGAMAEKSTRRVAALGGWDSHGEAAAKLFLDLARAKGHDVTLG